MKGRRYVAGEKQVSWGLFHDTIHNINVRNYTYQTKGVHFVREPKRESYGTVAVFEDIYCNLWDLVQPS